MARGAGRGKAGVSGDCQQPPAPQCLTGLRPSWQARESLAEAGWDEHRAVITRHTQQLQLFCTRIFAFFFHLLVLIAPVGDGNIPICQTGKLVLKNVLWLIVFECQRWILHTCPLVRLPPGPPVCSAVASVLQRERDNQRG